MIRVFMVGFFIACTCYLVSGSWRITSRPITLNTISKCGDSNKQARVVPFGRASTSSREDLVLKTMSAVHSTTCEPSSLQHSLSDLRLVVLPVSLVPFSPQVWKRFPSLAACPTQSICLVQTALCTAWRAVPLCGVSFPQ